MKWVTQERARVDRIAGPWRISHFIDKEATFLFVPADQVRVVAERDGTAPYDISGVELGHHGERCSIDAFLEKFKLTGAPSPRAHRAWHRHGCSTADPEVGRSLRPLHGIQGIVKDNMAKQFPAGHASK